MGILPDAGAAVRGTLEVALGGLEAAGSSFDRRLELDDNFHGGLDACIGRDVLGAGAAGSSVVVLAGNTVADDTSSLEQTAVAAVVVQHSAVDASNDHDFLDIPVL